jgi:isopenicillin N synthase-like dioxygenase
MRFVRYKFDSEFAHQVAEPDAIDIYTLSQDHVLGTTPSRSNPPLLDSYRPSVKQFIHDSYSVITVIFDHLDERLALPGGTLASFNRLDQPSGTGIRLLRTSAETVGTQRTRLFSHTDIGSITLLFNVLGGLQVLQTGYENTPDSAGWGYVKPQPDHIIVNIGDSISQWTGGLLKGNRHRVTTPPGQQATCTRYSVGYLIRPALDAPMKRLESPVIPSLQEGEKEETRCAKEWESSKGKKVVTSQPQVIDPPITSEIENGVKLSPPIAV